MVGVVGPSARPRTAVVDAGAGLLLSAPLDEPLRGVLGAMATGDTARLPDSTLYRALASPVAAEGRMDTTRHARVVVERVLLDR
ncbi:hypothetical protein [Actinacidiphila oryziradicis]|uniref:Uncharacterized protein n=1 Tax=Actinacidiphila oryziradicis TaxID=2571141 RepID=A0A4U0RTS0_9ACTN|nr:hypothetical protein [Actinacidiphila oryziradicis]TJZ99515.1 hypothetical protein FCI23_45535 [Actinacidiphila oryziradicis]